MRMSAICRMFPITLLAATLHAAPCLAAWSHDPATSGVDITPNPNADSYVYGTALSDGAGGVWIAGNRAAAVGNDIWVQHMGATGAPAAGWPAAGITVGSGTGARSNAHIVLDGAGGVMVFWQDNRSGTHADIYGQRLNSAGVRQWTANGVLVNPVDTYNRAQISTCTDGAGGAFVAYRFDISGSDEDIYMTHVSGAGSFLTVPVATPLGLQLNPVITTDNLGGCYVAYEDQQGLSGTAFEVKLAHLTSANSFTFSNLSLDNANAANQTAPQMISDGTTGVYVSWLDDRSVGTVFTVATRIDLNGSPHTGWSNFGLSAHYLANSQDRSAAMTLDGSGGLFFVLPTYGSSSYGVVGHVSPNGIPYPAFGTSGVIVSASAQFRCDAVPDGAGGVFALFDDTRANAEVPAIVRVTSGGALGPATPYGGRVAALQYSYNQSLVADPNGGAFVLWSDYRTGNIRNYAAHVDRYGFLGDATPVSAGVKDIPADQGGAVRLTWNASWMDGDADYGIGSYWIWRQAPLTLANAAVRAGSGVWADAATPAEAAALVHGRGAGDNEGSTLTRIFQHDAVSPYAWEFLSTQNANGSARYSYVASTTSDSIANHNPYTAFMVEAHSAIDTRAFWQSAPDSGYSVDNLPPVVPAPFTATRASGVTRLHWNRNIDADLAGYRLYRGTSLGFVPSSATLISAQQDSGFADVTGSAYIYKLTAIDVHGNESPVAIAQPTGTLAVDGALPRELAFALASPNPARAGAVMRFALPSAAHVSIALYDAAGRQVRELANGEFAAGTFTRAWDGSDAAGAAAPSGLYFARMRSGGRVLNARFVLTR